MDEDSGTANHIGILPDQWQRCFQCNQTYGQCFVVNGSNPLDQFSPFRPRTVAQYLGDPRRRLLRGLRIFVDRVGLTHTCGAIVVSRDDTSWSELHLVWLWQRVLQGDRLRYRRSVLRLCPWRGVGDFSRNERHRIWPRTWIRSCLPCDQHGPLAWPATLGVWEPDGSGHASTAIQAVISRLQGSLCDAFAAAGQLFMNIQNTGNITGHFIVIPKQCCNNHQDGSTTCGAASNITISDALQASLTPGQNFSFTFTVGECSSSFFVNTAL